VSSQRRDDNRAVDEDRVLEHEINQLLIGPLRVRQPQLVVRRAFLAKDVAYGITHRGDQCLERFPVGWGFQILNDVRLLATVSNEAQYVSRGAASGVVIDRDRTHKYAF